MRVHNPNHRKAWESTRKNASPYPELEGPHKSMGVHIPDVEGHMEAGGGSISPHKGLVPCSSVAPQVGEMDSHHYGWPLELVI